MEQNIRDRKKSSNNWKPIPPGQLRFIRMHEDFDNIESVGIDSKNRVAMELQDGRILIEGATIHEEGVSITSMSCCDQEILCQTREGAFLLSPQQDDASLMWRVEGGPIDFLHSRDVKKPRTFAGSKNGAYGVLIGSDFRTIPGMERVVSHLRGDGVEWTIAKVEERDVVDRYVIEVRDDASGTVRRQDLPLTRDFKSASARGSTAVVFGAGYFGISTAKGFNTYACDGITSAAIGDHGVWTVSKGLLWFAPFSAQREQYLEYDREDDAILGRVQAKLRDVLSSPLKGPWMRELLLNFEQTVEEMVAANTADEIRAILINRGFPGVAAKVAAILPLPEQPPGVGGNDEQRLQLAEPPRVVRGQQVHAEKDMVESKEKGEKARSKKKASSTPEINEMITQAIAFCKEHGPKGSAEFFASARNNPVMHRALGEVRHLAETSQLSTALAKQRTQTLQARLDEKSRREIDAALNPVGGLAGLVSLWAKIANKMAKNQKPQKQQE